MSLSVVSLNARGLRNPIKRKAVFLYLKQFKSDFCFLQECHSTVEDCNFWRSQWGLDIWMAHGTTHSAGVCILKNQFKGKVLLNVSDIDGCYICLVTEISNLTCILVCVYGYNQQKENENFISRLEELVLTLLTKYPNSMLIFGGDFNVAIDGSLDRWPPKLPDNTSLYLKTFMQRFSLIDSWRVLHPSQKMFTWSNNSVFPVPN